MNQIKQIFILLLVFIFTYLTFPLKAEYVTVDGLRYNLGSDNTCEYVGSTDSNEKFEGKLEIPSSIKYKEQEYVVTSIGNSAFWHCYEVTEIIIPNTVIEMGSGVFQTCTKLKEIIIPGSVLKIGTDPFKDTGLRTIIFEDGEETLTFGQTEKRFYMSPYLSTIYLGRSIEYPGTSYSYSNSPFYQCSTLKSVIIGDKVKSIKKGQFAECTALKDIKIGNSVFSIADFAFYNCKAITSVKLPDSVVSIGEMAFAGCEGLSDLELSNSLLQIGDNAFINCRNVSFLRIPDSVQSIGENAFSGLSISELIIPNSVISIGNSAFKSCTKLEKIIIGDSLSEIAAYAFDGVDNLEELVIGKSVSSVGYHAFTSSIGKLKKIISYAPQPPSLNSSSFVFIGITDSTIPVYVPSASVSLYKSHQYWKNYDIKSIIRAESITLKQNEYSLFVGESTQITATVAPENSLEKYVLWTSDNQDVAKVDSNGEITAVSVGVATITATCGEVSATCKVSVNPVTATSITLNVSELTMLLGATDKLTATVEPANTTDATITWKSDNEAVAAVSSDGVITALSVGTATLTATCGEVSATCKVTVNPVTATSITLNVSELTLLVGVTDKLTATVEPANTTDATITWKTDNEAVAVVSADGVITAISVGTATITATCDEVSATCKVSVNPVTATSITLNVSELTMLLGATDKLTATVEPANTTDATITWKSDNEAVATVSADGVITAISVGTATITVTCGEVSATCKVTVKPITASGITLNVSELTLLEGATDKLTATVEPANTTDATIIWKSDNEAVATVSSDGVITAISVGTATITATCGEVSATCKVTVKPITASGITLNVSELALLLGATDKLTATVEPANTTDATIIWKSDNEAVATVSSDGVITALSVGTATITATCGEVSATCKVSVNPVTATSITLNVSELTMLLGATDKLTATVEPANTTDATIIWKTDNEAVAAVSSDGVITAISVGTATITATCGEVSATCKVTVKPIIASSITLNVSELNLLVGATEKLTATVEPENATDPTITWVSDNEAVATVSAEGLVTAVSDGTAIIKVSCGEVFAECKVTVTGYSGVSILFGDENTKFEVYTLQGFKLKVENQEDLKRLAPGFYIINGKKIYLK